MKLEASQDVSGWGRKRRKNLRKSLSFFDLSKRGFENWCSKQGHAYCCSSPTTNWSEHHWLELKLKILVTVPSHSLLCSSSDSVNAATSGHYDTHCCSEPDKRERIEQTMGRPRGEKLTASFQKYSPSHCNRQPSCCIAADPRLPPLQFPLHFGYNLAESGPTSWQGSTQSYHHHQWRTGSATASSN